MQDNANTAPALSPVPHTEEIPASPSLPAKTQARMVVDSSKPKSFLARCFGLLRRYFFKTSRAEHLHLVRPAGAGKPIVFKGATAVTLMTPVGSYAGKTHKEYLRVLAEQAFETMNSSSGTTIH